MYSEKKYKQKITLGQSDNALILLIAICLIAYVGLAFMKAVSYFTYQQDLALPFFNKNVLGLFVLPADTDKLLSKPWTIITHMFVHDNVWKVFTNMIWLWAFGYIMQDITGNKKIIPVFIYGALGGAIAFLVAANLMPSLKEQLPFVTTMGASAGVMAVAITTTMIAPGYKIFPLLSGGMPLWVLTAFYVVTSLLTISFSDTINIIINVAGALTGFLFIFFLRRGYDWSNWMSNFFDWFGNVFNPDKQSKNKNLKDELFYKSTSAPYIKTPNVTTQRVDEVLEKVHQMGYDHLSEEEKDLLRRASEDDIN